MSFWKTLGKIVSGVTGADLLSTGVSLAGSLLGKSSNDNANATNLQIAQMNNDFNEKQLQKQMDYNTAMYERQYADNTSTWQQQYASQQAFQKEMQAIQNNYNSASSQRARLEEAGLNPYLMMSGGSAGTATSAGGSLSSSAGGAPSALGVNVPQASQVQVKPYDWAPALNSVSGAIQRALEYHTQKELNNANIDLIGANTGHVNIENQYLARKLESEIMFNNSQSALQDVIKDKTFQEYVNLVRISPEIVEQAKMQTRNMDLTNKLIQAETISETLKADLSWKELQYFDENALANLSVSAATAYNLYASGKCSYAAAQNYIANALKANEETRGIKFSNDFNEKNKPVLTRQLWDEARSSYWEANQARSNFGYSNKKAELEIRQLGADYWNPFRYAGQILGPAVGAGAGAYVGSKTKGKPIKVRGFGR